MTYQWSRSVVPAVLTVVSVSAHAQQWESLGPAPISWFGGSSGRISAVAPSTTNADRIYVAGADGGVWRTTDGGATWQPLTDHMPTTATGALAVDPTNDMIVYAGTGEANYANHSRYGLGVFKTIDGGDTWSHHAETTFAGRCFSKIAIDPNNTDVLYASITRAGGFPALAAAKEHPGKDGPVGVFKSIDAGVTWTRLTNGLPDLIATDIAISTDSTTVFAGIGDIFGDSGNGVYRSIDAGASWQKMTSGLPASVVGRVSVATAPSNSDVVYALFAQPSNSTGGGAFNLGGYKSINGGDTWTTYGDVSQSSYGWYLSCIGVNPADENMAFYGGLDMERVTQSGSATITPPHVDCHAVAFDANGHLLAGDDGGLHRSLNFGNDWESVNDGLGVVQFYAGVSIHPLDANVVIGGTQDNGTNARYDGSQSWTTVNGGDGGWTRIDQQQPNIWFAEAQGTGNLSRSTNSGQSFGSAGGGLSGRNCFLPPYVIDPSSLNTVYYATHRIHKRTFGSTGWQVISGDLTKGAGAIRALAISPSNPDVLYMATNDGNVGVSTNAGVDWTVVISDNPGWPRVTREISTHPTEPGTAYLAGAVFGQAHVRRTTNYGQSWETLDGNLPDVPVNVVDIDPRTSPPTLYAGADDGIYRSTDDGVTWVRFGQNLPHVPVIDVIMDIARERIVIGTQGRGAWVMDLSSCIADCDGNALLNIFDYICFGNAYAMGSLQADCDGNGVLNIFDYICFGNAFAAGCP
ncbi:MAG: hypothetical protein H6815_03035 [Phycisphaeraceae bacterium]|nr:hypothetical protein [Phycisphaerales bacterium]MCB9859402.1 hypothetical protein [Phycisphaeraceae bacterium]